MYHTVSGTEIRMMIQEERELIEQYQIIDKLLIAEARARRLDGLSIQEINEGIVTDILGGLGGIIGGLPRGFIEQMKSRLALYTFSKLGLDPTGLLAKALGNVIEAISFTDLPKYFGPQGCHEFADAVTTALGETMVEEGVEIVLNDVLKINSDSMIRDTFRESITNAMADSAVGSQVRAGIAEFVCSIDFSDVLSAAKDVPSKVGGWLGSLFGGDEGPDESGDVGR